MPAREKGLLAVGMAFIIGIIILGGYYHMIRKRVTEVAQKYVAENFAQEMKFVNTTVVLLPLVDGARHRSYFSPMDNHKLVFCVEVEPSTFIVRGNTYYSVYFELNMKNTFMIDVSNIWKDDASLDVSVRSANRHKLTTPSNFDYREPITDTLEEMAEVFYSESFRGYGFDFIISVNRSIDDDSKIEESNRIWDFIQVLKNSNFKPAALIFFYENPSPSITDRIFNHTKIETRINDWSNIETAEQVLGIVGMLETNPQGQQYTDR
jgi:hypothetical protein